MGGFLKRAGWIALLLVACSAAGAGAVYIHTTQDYPLPMRAAPSGPLAALVPAQVRAPSDRIVVMLVFDGLPGALVERMALPSLARLAQEGAHTSEMLPVFPTLSAPNHVALSTGCRPEHTGIVSNRFIDPSAGLYGNDGGDARWLLGCEPLPEVAERQGVRTAILGWGAATRGRAALAEFVDELRQNGPSFDQRLRQLLDQLHKPSAERAQLLVAYFTEPDATLHPEGLDSERAQSAVHRVDDAIGRVAADLEQQGLLDRAVLLVVSDHGMMPVDKHLNIGAIARRAGVDAKIAADGAIAHIYLDDPATLSEARKALAQRPEFDVFPPAEQPDWTQLGTSKRLGDLIVVAKPGYYMFDRGLWPKDVRWAALFGPDVLPRSVLRGSHGYPSSMPEMRSVFYAWGAGIARGMKIVDMHAVDVHPTIAQLLGIEHGKPVDGRAHTEILIGRDGS